MLGRLFSSSFGISGPSGSNSGSTSSPEGNNNNNSTAPVSMLEEADTRGLLYGSAVKSKPDLNIDPVRDIRVVVISDIHFLDDLVFDSVTMDQPSITTTTSSSSATAPSLARTASYNAQQQQQQRGASSSAGKGAGPEPLPLTLMKEILFGPTPIRYHSSVTKLHPFPSTNTDRPTSRTWLVSKLFKLGQNDLVDSVPTKFVSQYKSAPTSTSHLSAGHSPSSTSLYPESAGDKSDASDNSEEEEGEEEEEGQCMPDDDTILKTKSRLNWNPVNSVNYKQSPSMPKDVGCGICIFFNIPSDSQTMLTNHWEELSFGIEDLQRVVFNRLAEILPPALREYRARSNNNNHGTNTTASKKFGGLCDSDEAIRNAVEFFRTRFYGVVRIPRVICGQDRWPELLQEIRWAAFRLDDERKEDDFLSCALAAFINCNQKLVKNNKHHKGKKLKTGPLGDPPTRTIIVGNNRITARKLIFILTSLIHDSSTQKWNERLDMVTSRYNNRLEDESTDDDDDDEDDEEDDDLGGSSSNRAASSASSSPASRSNTTTTTNAVFSSTEGGWEIPTSISRTSESSSTCTMPHVIRPSFSSLSLSNSLSNTNQPIPPPSSSSQARMRYPSFEGLRKSFGSSSSSGGPTNTSSFLTSIWSSPGHNNNNGSSFTSTDSFLSSDDLYTMGTSSSVNDHFYDELPSSGPLPNATKATRPKLDRWNSSERTATTLGPISNIPRTNTIASMEKEEEQPPSFKFTNDNEADILDVAPLDNTDDLMARPIILPSVAGHIPDLHPDFGIQAVPLNRDLEEKIARTMVRDADVVPVPSWAANNNNTESTENNDESAVLSRTLIMNLRKREIYEWSLTRKCNNSGCQQELIRRKLYSGLKAEGEYREMTQKVTFDLKEIIKPGYKGGDENIQLLKKAYKHSFHLA